MAPVARELSRDIGVLEPLQTAASVDGQVAELAVMLYKSATPPVTLIGWSWGAWLALLTTARHPGLVERIILVGSGPFEAHYAGAIMPTRLSRLAPDERRELDALLCALAAPACDDRDATLARLGALLSGADAYDPLPTPGQAVAFQGDIYCAVWDEAEALRRSGRLLALAATVRCPVLAIHGDYDPHPAQGVCEPLSRVVDDFRFVLLERCGHDPWIERHARDRFYGIVRRELGLPGNHLRMGDTECQ
jgi:pimeloyl-ACP methyl ester carboxylesterase